MGYRHGRKKLEQVEVSDKKLETDDEIDDSVKSDFDMN